MVVVMSTRATEQEVEAVIRQMEAHGFRAFINPGVERKVIAALGEVDIDKVELIDVFANMPGVERAELISQPFKLSSRTYHPEQAVVRVGGAAFGSGRVVVVAGPCSVESSEQIVETAKLVKSAGADALRGGAFKPRTSPHSFQGLGEEGLKMLEEARRETGLPVVTEVLDSHDVELVARYADMLQIGARNMQNFGLLRRAGATGRPVLLKRGPGSRIRDLLMAAEYILAEGNPRVVLCERGITTFEDAARYTTDINAVPILKHLSQLPVILDPSHGTGDWRYVTPVARAGIAAGADGLIVEVHPDPQHARSDGKQSLKPEKFARLMRDVAAVATAIGREPPAGCETSLARP